MSNYCVTTESLPVAVELQSFTEQHTRCDVRLDITRYHDDNGGSDVSKLLHSHMGQTPSSDKTSSFHSENLSISRDLLPPPITPLAPLEATHLASSSFHNYSFVESVDKRHRSIENGYLTQGNSVSDCSSDDTSGFCEPVRRVLSFNSSSTTDNLSGSLCGDQYNIEHSSYADYSSNCSPESFVPCNQGRAMEALHQVTSTPIPAREHEHHSYNQYLLINNEISGIQNTSYHGVSDVHSKAKNSHCNNSGSTETTRHAQPRDYNYSKSVFEQSTSQPMTLHSLSHHLMPNSTQSTSQMLVPNSTQSDSQYGRGKYSVGQASMLHSMDKENQFLQVPLSVRISLLQLQFITLSNKHKTKTGDLKFNYELEAAKIESQRYQPLLHAAVSPWQVTDINTKYDEQHLTLIDSVEQAMQTFTSSVHHEAPSVRKPKWTTLSTTSVKILEQYYSRNMEHPYPSYRTAEALAEAGGITVEQVKKWFANRRMRSRNTKKLSDIAQRRKITTLNNTSALVADDIRE